MALSGAQKLGHYCDFGRGSYIFSTYFLKKINKSRSLDSRRWSDDLVMTFDTLTDLFFRLKLGQIFVSIGR